MQTLKNIAALCYKELRSLFGDTTLVILIIWVFTALIYSAATGVTTDVNHAGIGIIDLDQSQLTRRLSDAMLPPHFQKPVSVKREDVDDLMDKSKLVFVLEFPPNFQRDLEAGRTPEVQLLTDATTITQAGQGQNYIAQILQDEITQFLHLQGVVDKLMPVKPVINVQFNPNGESSWPFSVMEVDNMIALITLVLVGAAIIREREHGTIEHLLVMPVTATEIVLAKILANGLVVCTAATLSLYFMVGKVIGVPIAGSLWLYVLGVVLFMFSVASLAVMLATLAPTMPQYSLLMMPTYIVALMFSGSSSPRSNMPEAAQAVSEYWPTTLFAEFAQNVVFRGAGLETVWPQLVGLAVTGGIFLVFALSRFRKMLEKQG